MNLENRKFSINIFVFIVFLNIFVKSLPIQNSATIASDVVTVLNFTNFKLPVQDIKNISNVSANSESTEKNTRMLISRTQNKAKHLRSHLQPGQTVRNYNVQITINGGWFHGRALIEVRSESRDVPLKFNTDALDINSVLLGRANDINVVNVDFSVDDNGILEVYTNQQPSNLYFVIIEYRGAIRNDGTGIFMGHFNNQMYLGMNLYPTYAKRVFPCVDELTEIVPTTFTFNQVDFPNMVSNSLYAANSVTEFRTLPVSLHLWAMMAHNFPSHASSTADNVILYGRSAQNQHVHALRAISYIFDNLNQWTDKNIFDVIVNQNNNLNVFALPDTSVAWHGLSTVSIWEPYVYMETVHSIAHRHKALVKIGEALAGQWFGFVIYPQNWRHQWVITGLQLYSAYEILREFQSDPYGLDTTLLDINTLFVSEVIQESLLRDAFAVPDPLLLEEDIMSESQIRRHLNGIIKYKAPAMLWMLKNILGETDYIQRAAKLLLNHWSLESVTTFDFIDMIDNAYFGESEKLIQDIESFMWQWVQFTGFPLVTVQMSGDNVFFITRDHYESNLQINYTAHQIPITYTTNVEMSFDNTRPMEMLQHNMLITTTLPDEDDVEFILLNIQGQGYYRVNYDKTLWKRIIMCLNEISCRKRIHPLNRATLIDDSLNLARAGKLSYDTALQVILTMELETEYAPWKAYIRNMNFISKRLMAFIAEFENRDENIYLRMVQRIISGFEDQITFKADPSEPAMMSLTRGLVMTHACRAGYTQCVAAAIESFFDPNSNAPAVCVDDDEGVFLSFIAQTNLCLFNANSKNIMDAQKVKNPNIPRDIRPAVFCTMVREGDAEIINMLHQRLQIESNHYERIVILESLACSQDAAYIRRLLAETISEKSPYGVEERSKILAAVLESNYQNARIGNIFISQNIIQIRNMYGGPEKLEEILWILAENCANDIMTNYFNNWVSSSLTLDDSSELARKVLILANQNLIWDRVSLGDVYEWIDRNNAPNVVSSKLLMLGTMLIFLMLQVGK